MKIGRIETNDDFTNRVGDILRLLGIASKSLRELTEQTIAAEKEYKYVHSNAILHCGTNKELSSAELRKAKAELVALDKWELMQIAKFRRENCLEWIDTLKKALMAVQSIGANVRAEMQMSGIEPTGKGKR